MTPENFCYWLQGLLEVGNPKTLDEVQLQIIKGHLALVFNKVTPNRAPLKGYDFSIDPCGSKKLQFPTPSIWSQPSDQMYCSMPTNNLSIPASC